jgi:predicted Zn-dependent peptidase
MYRKTVLQNGIRIISEPLEHVRSISLGLWVGTGSRDESAVQNGISHFIEHMIFKGTHKRTGIQIAKDLDAIGGLSNAFTGKESTCFHARVLDKHLGLAVDILTDILLNSTFYPTDMERERQVILQEISMVEDTPDDSIHELFQGSFWSGHPIGKSVLGTDTTVGNIGKNAILDYMREHYVPEQILVVAAGNVSHEELISQVEPILGGMSSGNGFPQRNTPQPVAGLSAHYKKLEQVHMCLGGEAPSQVSDKRFACALLNTMLGGNMSSRLFQEIRENRGLAYNVYSFMTSYVDTGLLGIYVATDPSSVNPVLQIIQREIQSIVDGKVSPRDLEAAKEHLIGTIYLASESGDSRMMRMARNELVFEKYISYEELIAELEQVRLDDLIEVTGSVFHGGISLSTLGPIPESDIDTDCLSFT